MARDSILLDSPLLDSPLLMDGSGGEGGGGEGDGGEGAREFAREQMAHLNLGNPRHFDADASRCGIQ